MPITVQDLIKHAMLGGGSSGSGGGGSAAVSPKEVNFYDYDGTCVYAYTVAEAQALTELPAGPEHPGLVFQGWNWSLEGVKGLTRAMNIGAMYTTDDGTTRLYITLQEGRTSPMLGVGVNGAVTVDWGDGTEPDVLTGTNVSTTKWTPNHAYAAPGDYVIRLTVEGSVKFGGSGYRCNLLRYKTTDNDYVNDHYASAIRRIEIGDNVSLDGQAFAKCYMLETISVPQDAAQSGQSVFAYCYSLKAFNASKSMSFSEGSNIMYMYALKTFVFAENTVPASGSLFYTCPCLENVTLPDGIASMGYNMFNACIRLVHLTIPKTVSQLSGPAFTSGVSLAVLDFTEHEAVPAMTSKETLPADCVFLIPSALYDEWIAATNWTTYADRCVAK